MKLLRTDSLEVVEFSPDVIPKYAILSHTWGRQEITWTDLRARTSAGLVHSSVKKKEGYAKVCRSADVAARDGYHYIWIDSCCIDKTNHAELQEAINSMYKWYERSDVCYVYFEDFDIDNDLETREVDDEFEYLDQGRSWQDRLKSCRWFTRGWTLQELVAPRKRKHFDLNWACIDDAVSKIDLARTIEERTGVPQHILGNRQSLASINVASKMRWAAGRRTTRPEDMAYSLFGIFNVNLQTCYGEEGLAAFIRLQDAIIRQSADETIFAWTTEKPGHLGLLAESPDWFIDCSRMRRLPGPSYPWTMTNQGLAVSLLMKEKAAIFGSGTHYDVFLNWLDPYTAKCPSFTMVKLAYDRYARTGALGTVPMHSAAQRMSVTVPQESPSPDVPPVVFHCSNFDSTFMWKPSCPGDAEDWNFNSKSLHCIRPRWSSSHDSHVAAIELVKADKKRTPYQEEHICTVVFRIQWVQFPGNWRCLCRILPSKDLVIPEWDDALPEKESQADKFGSTAEFSGLEIVAQAPSRIPWYKVDRQVNIGITVWEAKTPEKPKNTLAYRRSRRLAHRKQQHHEEEEEEIEGQKHEEAPMPPLQMSRETSSESISLRPDKGKLPNDNIHSSESTTSSLSPQNDDNCCKTEVADELRAPSVKSQAVKAPNCDDALPLTEEPAKIKAERPISSSKTTKSNSTSSRKGGTGAAGAVERNNRQYYAPHRRFPKLEDLPDIIAPSSGPLGFMDAEAGQFI